MNETYWMRVAAALGACAVILGAAGAHGPLHELLRQRGLVNIWQIALFQHVAHAVVLLVLSQDKRAHPAALWLFLAGILLFSGSLYLMCAFTLSILGPVTPVGGLCLLGAWIWLMLGSRKAGA